MGESAVATFTRRGKESLSSNAFNALVSPPGRSLKLILQ